MFKINIPQKGYDEFKTFAEEILKCVFKNVNIGLLHLATAVYIVLVNDILDFLFIRIDAPVVLQVK